MIFFFIITIIIIEMGLSLSHFSLKHNKIFRNQLRLGYFLCVIILLITQMLTISITFLLFYIWIFIIGIVSIIQLNKEPTHQIMHKERFKSVRFILLLCLSLMPAILTPNYAPLSPTGSYKVKHEVVKLIDQNRIDTLSKDNNHRLFNLEIWYPEAQYEKFPIIIYSHGGISHARSHQSLFYELASHGYVLVSVDHTYHSLSVHTLDDDILRINRTYLNQLLTENAQKNPKESYAYYQEWMELRTKDLIFAIDRIIELTEHHPDAIFQSVDVTKIGVMGHSLGGSAAMCLGNLRDDINAIIALESPMLCDIIDVDDQTFIFREHITSTPLLHVYTKSAWHHLSDWKQYGQNIRLINDPLMHTHAVYFKDMYHFGLTDLSLSNPLLARFLHGFKKEMHAEEGLRNVNEVTIAFFDDYLKSIHDFSTHPWLWSQT